MRFQLITAAMEMDTWQSVVTVKYRFAACYSLKLMRDKYYKKKCEIAGMAA